MATLEIEDSGPNGLHGRLVNLPTRAMKGAAWTGEERDWKARRISTPPSISTTTICTIAAGPTISASPSPRTCAAASTACSCAAGRIATSSPSSCARRSASRAAKVCYIASTFTYQVYGNFSRGLYDEPFRKRVADWKAAANNPDDNKDYGLSTYNFHRDGSGVAYSSHLRPLLSWRPDYITFNDAAGSGLRHLPADTHLTGWLDRMGIAYDVVTDHDLHEKGVEILASYKVVMTGTHPEYHTERTLDALQAYTETGGRLMYLGGNGFYWRVALSDAVPGAIEVRRTEGGIRTWPAEPGEYYHAFDGAYGGLWRRSDRPPNLLCGIGFSSQGKFVGDPYRQAPAARDNHHAWVFEGVKDELFGGYGLSGGGAAGFELDRLDHRLGSPLNAVVLASSEGHDRKEFVVVHEERLGFDTTIPGQTLEELIRADMTYIEKPRGGAIFSVGSITYRGGLPHNKFDNDVSRLTFNVVNQFGELGLKWPIRARTGSVQAGPCSPLRSMSSACARSRARCRHRDRATSAPSGRTQADGPFWRSHAAPGGARRRGGRGPSPAHGRSGQMSAVTSRAARGRRCRSRAAPPPRGQAVTAAAPAWPA